MFTYRDVSQSEVAEIVGDATQFIADAHLDFENIDPLLNKLRVLAKEIAAEDDEKTFFAKANEAIQRLKGFRDIFTALGYLGHPEATDIACRLEGIGALERINGLAYPEGVDPKEGYLEVFEEDLYRGEKEDLSDVVQAYIRLMPKPNNEQRHNFHQLIAQVERYIQPYWLAVDSVDAQDLDAMKDEMQDILYPFMSKGDVRVYPDIRQQKSYIKGDPKGTRLFLVFRATDKAVQAVLRTYPGAEIRDQQARTVKDENAAGGPDRNCWDPRKWTPKP